MFFIWTKSISIKTEKLVGYQLDYFQKGENTQPEWHAQREQNAQHEWNAQVKLLVS